MHTVQSIYIYPIKGMRGISLQEADLEAEGFRYDRRWMLVDEAGTFISQRNHPIIATFVLSIDDKNITVNHRDDYHQFPINSESDQSLNVTVFDDSMIASEVSKATSQWFSEQLQKPVKLVRHSGITQRIKAFGKYLAPSFQNAISPETVVSFADGYPYLVIGTASLENLNQKLQQPLPMNRFRPNIVVQTNIPHEEDDWRKISIGDQKFFGIKPCARCQVTTVNQATGSKGKEPLPTLSTYRKSGKGVNFGMNLISLSNGIIRINDVVLLG